MKYLEKCLNYYVKKCHKISEKIERDLTKNPRTMYNVKLVF